MSASNAGARHTISHARALFHGDAQHNGANNSKRGVPLTPIVQTYYAGTDVVTADSNALVTKQAFSTVGATYTLATAVAGATAHSDATQRKLRTPRNITITTSDLAATATVIITGKDQYGEDMWERILVTASDTTVSGAKAFSVIETVRGGTGATGVFYVGFGDRLGLPYKVARHGDVLSASFSTAANTAVFVSALATANLFLPTYTATEVHSATAQGAADETIKDVRGTWAAPDTPDGVTSFSLWYKISDNSSKFGSFGITQVAS